MMETSRVKFPPKRFDDFKDPAIDCEQHIQKGKDKKGFTVRYINGEIVLLLNSLRPEGIHVLNNSESKGKGVFTTKDFRQGDFLLEYPGELIPIEIAREREKNYPSKLGSFLFFFKDKKEELCIDATFSRRKGRFINDGFGGTQNAEMKHVKVGGTSHLAIFATRNIKAGEQVLYDYGVSSLPWRIPNETSSKQKVVKDGKGQSKTVKNASLFGICSVTKESVTTPRNDSHGSKDTNSPSGVPEGPSYLTAVPAELNAAVILSWGAPIDNGGLQIHGYTIMKNIGGSKWQPVARVKSNIQYFTVLDLELEKPYRFAVMAHNAVGTGPSTEVQSDVKLKRTQENCQEVIIEEPFVKDDNEVFTAEHIQLSSIAAESKNAAIQQPSVQEGEDEPLQEPSVQEANGVQTTESMCTSLVSTSIPTGDDESLQEPSVQEANGVLTTESMCTSLVSTSIPTGENRALQEPSVQEASEVFTTEPVRISSVSTSIPTGEDEALQEPSVQEANDVLVSTSIATGLPGAPLYLTIRPGYSNVSLSWEAPPNNNGDFAIDRYCVVMKTNNSNWCDIARVNSNIRTYTVENLQPSTPYRFCISAENRIGRGPSVEVQADVYLQRLSASPSREMEEIYLSYGTLTNDSDQVSAGKPTETTDGGFDMQNNKEKVLGEITNDLNLNADEDLTPESINPRRQSRKSDSDQVSAGQPNETVNGMFDVQNNQKKVIGRNANVLNLNADEDLTSESINPSRQSRKSDSDAGYSSEEAGKKRKPYRPCPYCHAYKSDLSDHIKRKHADEDVVKRALSLPRYERIRAFRQLKKDGIMKANMQILRSRKEKSVKILRERQPQPKKNGKAEDNQRPVVYCSECHGFVSSKYFARHRKNCMSVDASTIPQSIPTSLVCNVCDNEDYKRDILKSFHQDAIGKICVTDELIVGFGYREFKAIRTQKDKHIERRTTLKTKMRRLGTLYDCFKRKCCASSVDVSSAVDMFKRTNFSILEDTIYTLTSENGDKMKTGLKVGFGYILKNVCKYLHGEYLIQGKDTEATEINRFLAVLNYHWASMFGDAEYANSIKRQEVLRKPQKLPKQQDIKTLRDFTLKKIQELTDDAYLFVANTEYSLLRDLVVSRLTLFNARRGGEPSRLLLEEWSDALNDVWYNNTETVDDPLEKFLLGRYKLAYQSGKRVKLVPLLIVDDCWKAIEILSNPEIRKQVNVHASNRFVFPYTQFSTSHVLGWKAVEKCCHLAELDNSITATQMRHYVATVYAALEIPDEERKQFYEHMGHSEAVNKNVYQSPLAVKEVIQVGGFLDRLDRGQLSETVSRRSSSSEDSRNDTRFTEMTPLNDNGSVGYNQQDVRSSDSCGVCQTYTSPGALTTAEHSITTSVIISTTSDRYTSSPVVDINSVVSDVPPDSLAVEPVVRSSAVKNNPTGTSVFAFSAVSTEPSIVPAIVYPVTTALPTLILRSSTEAVSDPASSSNPTFQEPDTTACVTASATTDHVGVEYLSEGICTDQIKEGNADAGHRDVSSPDFDVQTVESMNAISSSTRDKLTAKLNTNQMRKERSAILPLKSRNKIKTTKDSRWRPKIAFVNSSRVPDPQGMDYSDSGSSCQSTPTKKRIYRLWSTEHTKTIQKCFERYIRDTSDIKGNTGPLPSADEIKVFIQQHPEILPDVTLTTKIARIKTKVFNERKELRRKMAALEGSLENKQ